MLIDKSFLRRRLRTARNAAAHDAPIAPPPAFWSRLAPGVVVASYVPVGSEADPAAFERAAAAVGASIALPHVIDRQTPLRFLHRPTNATLTPGPFGLRNPHHDWPAMTPDIILTPLIGFDRHGHRLGQGAGHYDRAFAAVPTAWRIGIALAVQEVEALPVDPWDVPLHAIATEREWIVAA